MISTIIHNAQSGPFTLNMFNFYLLGNSFALVISDKIENSRQKLTITLHTFAIFKNTLLLCSRFGRAKTIDWMHGQETGWSWYAFLTSFRFARSQIHLPLYWRICVCVWRIRICMSCMYVISLVRCVYACVSPAPFACVCSVLLLLLMLIAALLFLLCGYESNCVQWTIWHFLCMFWRSHGSRKTNTLTWNARARMEAPRCVHTHIYDIHSCNAMCWNRWRNSRSYSAQSLPIFPTIFFLIFRKNLILLSMKLCSFPLTFSPEFSCHMLTMINLSRTRIPLSHVKRDNIDAPLYREDVRQPRTDSDVMCVFIYPTHSAYLMRKK